MQDFQRVAVVSGRNYHLVKHRAHGIRRFCRNRAVEPDNAAKRRHRVALVGQSIRLGEVVPRGEAAGIGVLDYTRRRLVIVADRPPGRVRVHQVVERQLTPVELFSSRQPARAAAGRHVQRSSLVWVLAVAQR